MHTGEQGSKCRWEVGRDWSWSCLWTMLCWAKSLQSCPPPWDPMDCCPSGSSVQGFLQARILEWIALFPSRWSSQSRDRTCASYISCTGRQVLYHSHHQGNPAYGLGSGTWIGYNNDIIKNYKKCVQSAARKLHVCAMCLRWHISGISVTTSVWDMEQLHQPKLLPSATLVWSHFLHSYRS